MTEIAPRRPSNHPRPRARAQVIDWASACGSLLAPYVSGQIIDLPCSIDDDVANVAWLIAKPWFERGLHVALWRGHDETGPLIFIYVDNRMFSRR